MCRQGQHELGQQRPLPGADAFLAALERAPDSGFARSGFGMATAMFKYSGRAHQQWPEAAEQGHISICDLQSRSLPFLRYRPLPPPQPSPLVPLPQTPPEPLPVHVQAAKTGSEKRKKTGSRITPRTPVACGFTPGRFEHFEISAPC
jgi:hypothetical protein